MITVVRPSPDRANSTENLFHDSHGKPMQFKNIGEAIQYLISIGFTPQDFNQLIFEKS